MQISIHAEGETNHFILFPGMKILPDYPEGSFSVLTIAQSQFNFRCSFHTFHMSGRISKCAEHTAE